MNDEKLKLLNDKKVEAYNLLRKINAFDQQRQGLLNGLKKIEEEIFKLEQEYVNSHNAISKSPKKS